jgi:hypothetical protein
MLPTSTKNVLPPSFTLSIRESQKKHTDVITKIKNTTKEPGFSTFKREFALQDNAQPLCADHQFSSIGFIVEYKKMGNHISR